MIVGRIWSNHIKLEETDRIIFFRNNSYESLENQSLDRREKTKKYKAHSQSFRKKNYKSDYLELVWLIEKIK